MRPAALALIACATAAIALGVWTVGGPEQARAERRDQQRMSDLHALAQHVLCLRHEGLGPEDRTPGCPPPARRADPLTAERYRVEEISSTAVRVCASFETTISQHWWGSRADVDLQDGCLVARMRDIPPAPFP